MTKPLSKWLFWDHGCCTPSENMAWDEALLTRCGDMGFPVLRFYGWDTNAGTFGYFQGIREIESLTDLRPLVRRPTGGGFVPHANDWTYSAVFPAGHEWYSLRAEESYRKMHEWIRSAFEIIRLPTDLSPCCQKDVPGQCFIGAEKFDLMHEGRKLAGAAQRRNKLGLLIQGSIQPSPADIPRKSWQKAMLVTAQSQWNVEWETFNPDEVIAKNVQELVRLKYGNDDYNRRR